jgi:murein DD-endopeptidase MepM/ murein hydrolase activator NlpD
MDKDKERNLIEDKTSDRQLIGKAAVFMKKIKTQAVSVILAALKKTGIGIGHLAKTIVSGLRIFVPKAVVQTGRGIVSAAKATDHFIRSAASHTKYVIQNAGPLSGLLAKKIISFLLHSFLHIVHGFAHMKKSTAAAFSGTAAGTVAVVVVSLVIVNSHAIGVSINGQSVGYVADVEFFSSLVEDVRNELSVENNGATILIADQNVALADSSRNAESIPYLNKEQLKQTLTNAGIAAVSAYSITVDGNSIVTLPTEVEAIALVDSIIEQFADPNNEVEYAWIEDVAIENTIAPLGTLDMTTSGAALDLLLTGNVEIESYEIKPGDTLWDIAYQRGVSVDEILEYNPDMSATLIHIGDIVQFNRLLPYVHMTTTETAIMPEPIQFETIQEKSAEVYIGQKKIQTPGVLGQREVTRLITKVNGEVKESIDLNTVILSEPQPQIELIGTAIRPASGGVDTGGENVLHRPMDYLSVSSYYGGARAHKGVDFSTHVGTPIYASASGTVVSAGWAGAYGLCIVINHGNGIQTLYGHCSSLNVGAGQAVAQGQVIAASGNTGRSTGPHLHFEVRINGVQVNPLPYI